MSKFLHDNAAAKAIAIPQNFSENSLANKGGEGIYVKNTFMVTLLLVQVPFLMVNNLSKFHLKYLQKFQATQQRCDTHVHGLTGIP